MNRLIYTEYFLNKYLDDILKMYNYIDGIIITDEKGIIQYYNSFRPDLNKINPQEVLGKHILDTYPGLNEEKSTIMRVLKNGEHIYDEYQEVTSFKGQKRYLIETTIPIKDDDRVVGTANISRYIIQNRKMHDIRVSKNGQKEYQILDPEDGGMCSINNLISNSPAMMEIKNKILKIAKTSSNVLIYGETGTGKDIIAHAIHYHSARNKMPFIYQNCAAIPATLLESILFGTKKGAYTGAENRNGLFEMARDSTLFLDEINSLDIFLQPKILTAIEKKQIRKVGGTDTISTDIRLISAMNQEPKEVIDKERLRKDLFYRLSSILIKVPPLRERKEDIILLSNHFIELFNKRFDKHVEGISDTVETIFMNYDWYGNIRELKNIIEGAVALSNQAIITDNELPDYMLMDSKLLIPSTDGKPKNTNFLKYRMDEYEKQIIMEELKKGNNLSKVATNLGISRQALNYKIKKISK